MDSDSQSSCSITVTYPTDLGLDGLITCFKQAGPITAVEVLSKNMTTQTTRIKFKTLDGAAGAERNKDLWLLEATLNSKVEQGTVKPQRTTTRKRTHSPDIESRRLFCQLPWAKGPSARTPEQIEEEFFRHFAQFGTLEYVNTLRDKSDRLSHGYVKYVEAQSAQEALAKSDLKYRAILARPQYAQSIYNVKIRHSECGIQVDRRDYTLHQKTCHRQRTLDSTSTKTHNP